MHAAPAIGSSFLTKESILLRVYTCKGTQLHSAVTVECSVFEDTALEADLSRSLNKWGYNIFI